MAAATNEIVPQVSLKGFEGIIKGWVGKVMRPNAKVGNQYVTDVPVAHNFPIWNSATKQNEVKTMWVTVKLWDNEPLDKATLKMLENPGGYITARGEIQSREWTSKKTGKSGYTVEVIATQKCIETRKGGSSFGQPVAETLSADKIIS